MKMGIEHRAQLCCPERRSRGANHNLTLFVIRNQPFMS